MADTIDIDAAGGRSRKRPPRDERTPKAAATDATSRRGQDDTNGAAAKTPPPRRRSRNDDALIREALTGMYGMVGAGVAGIGQVQGNAGLLAAGVNVTLQSEQLADSWLMLADQVPAVRRALEGMVKGGAMSAVIMGNVGIALPVLAAAGIVPQQVGNMFLHEDAINAGQAFQAAQAAAQAAAAGMPA